MKKRGSGVLLHLSSLPSIFGIGDMGPCAYRFVDFLVESRQSYWQILPLSPTDLHFHNSPYYSASAFAFNPLFISPELLVRDQLLAKKDLEPIPRFLLERVDYPAVVRYKKRLLEQAYQRFREMGGNTEYDRFCLEHFNWLEDYVLFVALKSHFHEKMWSEWPGELQERRPASMQKAREKFGESIDRERFFQFICFKQWSALRTYCTDRSIQIIGDIPIRGIYLTGVTPICMI